MRKYLTTDLNQHLFFSWSFFLTERLLWWLNKHDLICKSQFKSSLFCDSKEMEPIWDFPKL